MGKSTPDDLSVRRQQLDDDESAALDGARADRLWEQQSAENGGLKASAQPQGKNKKRGAEARRKKRGAQADVTGTDKVQDQLDDALAASFPASDPVSIVTSQEEEDWGLEDRADDARPHR